MYQSRARIGLSALALIAACDVPTSLPNYDTEWNVPAKSTTISVNSLLPGERDHGDARQFGVPGARWRPSSSHDHALAEPGLFRVCPRQRLVDSEACVRRRRLDELRLSNQRLDRDAGERHGDRHGRKWSSTSIRSVRARARAGI